MAKGLPGEFLPSDRRHSLYEGVEYQGFWEDPRLRRQNDLEQYLVSKLLPVSGRRILDLGGGYGRLAPCYLGRFQQVVLCDGSLSLLRAAQNALGDRAVFVAADVARLPFRPASFDCILTIRVLQHVQDLPDLLSEMRRVIARDGALVFSFHNKRNAKGIARALAARGSVSPFSPESTEPFPTLISRHPRVVEGLVRDARFSPPEYQGTAIVHLWADLTDKLGRRAPAGAGWAKFMGRSRLAPWLIGRSLAEGGDDSQVEGPCDDLLQCPMCGGDLDWSEQGYDCRSCSRGYPNDDGILDFRP